MGGHELESHWRGLPGAILSPSEWSHLPSHFSLLFLFPESCPWYSLEQVTRAPSRIGATSWSAELGTLLLLLPLHGQEAACLLACRFFI